MTALLWHPNATLTDRSGETLGWDGAQNVPASETAQISDPSRCIPAFFNALTQGKSPLLGKPTQAQDIAGTFFTQTSGSTGAPKLIRRTTDSWLHSIQVMQTHCSITPKSRVACIGDLAHSLTHYATVEALVSGAAMHLLTSTQIPKQGITHLYATPAQLRTMRTPAPTVKYVIVGGGPMDQTTQSHTKNTFPNARMYRFYGAAETSFITLAPPDTPLHTIGRPFPGAQIEIRNTSRQVLPAQTTGLVWVRSPMLFHSYAQGTSTSTQTDGNWVTVGEIGQLDEQGYLTLKGRQDRVLTIADQSISLDQIEAELVTQGSPDAAVVALPDPMRGHTLHGFVTKSIAPHPRLKTQTILKALPLLNSGKPDYPALRKLIS